MKESVIRKLEGLQERYEEVQALLGEPDVVNDQERFRNLTREYAQLGDVVAGFLRFQQATADLQTVLEMLDGDDADKATLDHGRQAMLVFRRHQPVEIHGYLRQAHRVVLGGDAIADELEEIVEPGNTGAALPSPLDDLPRAHALDGNNI